MPACPQHGKRTKFVRTYHLMIVKSANRPIDITLSECDGPPHHYIHFGPNGQISKALPRVKGKKGRYELSDSTGKLIETEWIASPETRKALSVASSLGWGKKGSKKRKARGKAISRASRQPEVRAAKSAATRRMHARRKSELAELRALKAAGPVRKPGPQPDVTIGADVEELYNQGIRWSKIKEQMDNRTGVHRSADAYRMLLKRYRDLKGRTN